MSSPTITTQPQSQVVNINSSATFTVVATSTLTIGYQWYFNCVAIGGATSASLTINPVNLLLYTPDPGWTGVDTFQYSIQDQYGYWSLPVDGIVTTI